MSETSDTSMYSHEGAAVDAPVGRVVGCSPSTLSTGEAASEGGRPESGRLAAGSAGAWRASGLFDSEAQVG
jgi:hypothetical protein